MGWIARLFGRDKQTSVSANQIGGVENLKDISGNPVLDTTVTAYSYETLHETIRLALAPALTELQEIGERLNVALATPHGGASSTNTEATERTVEYALAHFLGLLNNRGAGIQVNPAILGKTPDGNTVLPFEPNLQYLLLVMNPLFPGLYSAQIILPSTFTRVDQLALLPSGVRAKSLHIDTKKAPPGFVEAIRSLQENNANNLYLGMLVQAQDESRYELRYFPCTGSELRNTAPDRFPNDLMLYFDTQPRPIVLQHHVPNTEDILAALHEIENGAPDWLAKKETENQQSQP